MKNQITQEQEKIVIQCYVEEKRGIEYTAKQSNLPPHLVKKVLKENQIHIRNHYEATVANNMNRTFNKNEQYFDTESSNMAWLLGFLASDGNVSKKDNRIKIGLASVDRGILEKIKEEVKIENEIKDFTTSKGFSCSELCWSSQYHKKQLSKYNVVPQKSLPPFALSKQYRIDYIRGLFDGDGSISYLKNNKSLRWQICSGSKDILQWVADTLEKDYGIPKVNIITITKNSKNPIYYLQYSTNSTKKIYSILYTPNSLYLKRKKDKFDDIILHETTPFTK